ncbi:MAG: MFS transporter [Deltaproteobacteria bacterium]|nr:MFS transporter [Deltaproteobacteria bacterium]
MRKPSQLALILQFLDKLLYFAIVPNIILLVHRAEMLSLSDLAFFFAIHIIPLRGLPVIIGYYVDRAHLKQALLGGFILQAFFIISLCFVSHRWLFLLCGLGAGMGGGILAPVFNKILADGQQHHEEKQNFLYQFLGINIAAAVASLLAWPYLSLYTLLFFIPACVSLILMVKNLDPITRMAADEVHPNFFRSLTHILKHAPALKILILLSCEWAMYTMLMSGIPAIAVSINEKINGNLWIGLNAVTCILGYFIFIQKLKDMSRDHVRLQQGMVLSSIGMVIIACAPSLFFIFLAVVVFSLGELILSPTGARSLAKLAHPSMRGQYVSSLLLAGSLGEGGGQLFLSLYPHPRMVCFIVGIVSLFFTWYLMHATRTPPNP